jgi:uncharacterized protein (DUF1697 family)
VKWAAMLKGINLGKRTLVKADLLAAAEAAGFSEAKTLLASGNLVFEAGGAKPEAIERALHDAVKAATGIASEVFVRTKAELEAAIRANPFSDAAEARPSYLVVSFAREDLPADLPERIATLHEGPERIAVAGRELFVDFPNGQAESKLLQAMAKLRPVTPMTGRNWNTVRKLADML